MSEMFGFGPASRWEWLPDLAEHGAVFAGCIESEAVVHFVDELKYRDSIVFKVPKRNVCSECLQAWCIAHSHNNSMCIASTNSDTECTTHSHVSITLK